MSAIHIRLIDLGPTRGGIVAVPRNDAARAIADRQHAETISPDALLRAVRSGDSLFVERQRQNVVFVDFTKHDKRKRG